MADVHTGVITTVLSTLRTLPLWLFAGLAVVGFSILYLPSFGGINPNGFRTSWGVWVWIGTLSCSILALARGIDLAIRGYHASRTATLAGELCGSSRLTINDGGIWQSSRMIPSYRKSHSTSKPPTSRTISGAHRKGSYDPTEGKRQTATCFRLATRCRQSISQQRACHSSA